MCAKIPRPGSGCTNTGASGRSTPTANIRFTRTPGGDSTHFFNRTMRRRPLHRQLGRQRSAMVDKVPPCFSSMQRMRGVSRLILLAAAGALSLLTGGGSGRYVGYPMGYWCEFAPAYGFHQGYVHLHPRTHGCIRLHGEAAPKFFALVKIGTPVNIAMSQPQDDTVGPKVQRVDDSK